MAYVSASTLRRLAKIDLERTAELSRSPSLEGSLGGSRSCLGPQDPRDPLDLLPDTAFDAYGPTRLWLLDDRSGELTEGVTLPSWGDNAYPGIEVTAEGDLLVVYYSCSQTIDANLLMGPGPLPGKYAPTSIYLARVVMD